MKKIEQHEEDQSGETYQYTKSEMDGKDDTSSQCIEDNKR